MWLTFYLLMVIWGVLYFVYLPRIFVLTKGLGQTSRRLADVLFMLFFLGLYWLFFKTSASVILTVKYASSIDFSYFVEFLLKLGSFGLLYEWSVVNKARNSFCLGVVFLYFVIFIPWIYPNFLYKLDFSILFAFTLVFFLVNFLPLWLQSFFHIISLGFLFGLAKVLFILKNSIIFDVTAYFAGRIFGGRKLLPSVSPNKTWAGFLGGIGVLFLVNFNFKEIIGSFVASVFWGAVFQIGDLIQSYQKRLAGVKDSGDFFGSHGGIWDRFDGFVFAMFVLHLMEYVLLVMLRFL